MIEIIKSTAILMSEINTLDIYKHIELCGRTCYKSDGKQTDISHEPFIKNLIKRGHESVLEHASVSFEIICSRACSHQLVRHRIASYSQESQRYVSYKKEDKLQVICPDSISVVGPLFKYWLSNLEDIYDSYCYLIDCGVKPEDARSLLPNCVATRVSTTMNIRSWRHFLKMRLDKHAQGEIRDIANQVLATLTKKVPLLVQDIK